MNENLGEFIKNSRNKKGLTLIEISWQFAQKTGKPIDPNYVSRLERGAILRPEKERLKIIAEILDLDIDELYRLADYYSGLEPIGEMIKIPMGDIAAGPGVFGNQTIYLSKNLLTTDKVIGYRVRGSSMEPEILEDSIIVVDLETKPKKEQIVVAWVGGQGMVKRILEREGQMYLVGKSGEPILVDDSVSIEGPVVFVGRFL